MSELKFSCPACGQHISCSKAAGGHIIHCPACCAELRIPFADGHGDATDLKAERVIDGHQTVAGSDSADKIAAALGEKELHCRCPVCQSKLRIPASVAMQADGIFPSAELVMKSPETLPSPAKPATPATSAPVEPVTHEAPMSEREQKIAAERAARTVSLYPQMKPRLELLLGGKSSVKSPAASSDEPKEEDWMKKAANE